jgi:bifunctional DNA-binding transcriptional regulator/antitoxin component of YhaV-PrlF toxin-antitoxin module
MIKLHITSKGQTTFPKSLREMLGVAPGGDIIVELVNGRATLAAHSSPAGMLSKYAKPNTKLTSVQSIGRYLGELDAKTRNY